MVSVQAQYFGYSTDEPLPLPRFDGRPVGFTVPRPAPGLASCTISLQFWQTGIRFRDVSRAALDVATEKANSSIVVFFGQLSTDSRRVRDRGAIRTFTATRLGEGGAENLERAIRDQDASVVVVDNLRDLMPRIHWAAGASQLADADREILREIRRLISGFGREIEAVLFHFVSQAGAEQLLAEGFVDRIGELQL